MNAWLKQGVKRDKECGVTLAGRPGGVISPFVERILLSLKRCRSRVKRDTDIVEAVDTVGQSLGQVLNPGTAYALREDLRSCLMQDDAAFVSDVGDVEAVRLAWFDPEEHERVQALLEQSDVRDMLHRYFGCDVHLPSAAIGRYKYVPAKKKLSVVESAHERRWHIDFLGRFNTLRLLVFLTDQEETGALEVVGREDTRRLVERFGYDALEEDPELVERHADIERYHGKRGSAVLFDPETHLHRGQAPSREDGVREVLILSVAPQ